MEKIKRYLVFEDGTIFEGEAFGGNQFEYSEVVSNSNMFTYQEALFDSKYQNKLVVMTYPLIGNYGVTKEVLENNTDKKISGLIIGELCTQPSNWRLDTDLDTFMKEKNIAGISNIDTRMIAKIVRRNPGIKAVFVDNKNDVENVLKGFSNLKLEGGK